MHTYVTAYRLINFQSWDASTDAIHLEPDTVNIIEGANETGKSVLYKVLYNFAFPGYWEPKELIRRGCTSGVLLMELSNGKCIIFQLEHSHHTYILVDNANETIWKDCALPQEIIDELGIILDYDLKIILNVIDKDISLPFIKTSPKFNASLIKSRVEPPDITEFFQNTDELQKQLSNACTKFATKTRELKAAADTIQFTDVDELYVLKENVDALFPVAKHYSDFEAVLEELAQLRTAAPTPVADPSVVTPHLQALTSIEHLGAAVDEYVQVVETKPMPIKDPSRQQNTIQVLRELQSLKDAISGLSSTLENKPCAVTCPNLAGEFEVWSRLSAASLTINELQKVCSEYSPIRLEAATTLSDLEKMRSEIGVCPTCGRLLDGGHT